MSNKKNDPFEGAEIEQDSEPLRFEEASSLFDEEQSTVKKESLAAEPEATQEVVHEETTSEEEVVGPGIDEDIHTIGAFLRQMREEKGVSIKIVSQHTKISVTNLELLEADDLEKLPNRAYVKGYVKSYAKTLSLNQNDYLELLDMTYGIEKSEEPKRKSPEPAVAHSTQPKKETKTTSSDEETNGIKFGIAIGALAIVAFLLILNNVGKEEPVVQEEPVPVETVSSPEPAEEVVPQTLNETTPLKEAEETPLSVTKVESEGEDEKPEVLATPIPKEQLQAIVKPTPLPTPEPTPEVKPTPAPTPEPVAETKKGEEEKKVSFKPLSTALYSDDQNMSQEDIDLYLPSRYRAAVVDGQQNVFINAVNNDSWLTYKSDDDPIKKFVLRKGRTILIRGQLIRIFIGNLAAVKVFRNNKPQKISSPSNVKSLVFPQERASEFVIPLFIFPKTGGVVTSEEYLENNPQD